MAAFTSFLWGETIAAAAARRQMRLFCVLLWFVRGEHVSGLSCYNNPNRLMGRAEAAAGGGRAQRRPAGSTGTNQKASIEEREADLKASVAL